MGTVYIKSLPMGNYFKLVYRFRVCPSTIARITTRGTMILRHFRIYASPRVKVRTVQIIQ